jgi:hypothetical protein
LMMMIKMIFWSNWWNEFGRGNRSTRRKPAPGHFVHHKIPLASPGLEPRTAAVGSQRLTAWAMARPWIPEILGSNIGRDTMRWEFSLFYPVIPEIFRGSTPIRQWPLSPISFPVRCSSIIPSSYAIQLRYRQRHTITLPPQVQCLRCKIWIHVDCAKVIAAIKWHDCND